MQETSQLLKNGLKNVRSRIESTRVFNEQVFEIQKNFRTRIVQPTQQNSFQRLEIDLSMSEGSQIFFSFSKKIFKTKIYSKNSGMVLPKYRKKFAMGFRNPFPSSATQLEIVLPPIKGLDDFQTVDKIKKYFIHENKKKTELSDSKILEMVQKSLFNSELFEMVF